MKEKIITAVSTLMIFISWTILILRQNPWALESPIAEIMISGYAAFMIFSGVFTVLAYVKGKVGNNLMKICLVINSMYGIGGIAVFGLMTIR